MRPLETAFLVVLAVALVLAPGKLKRAAAVAAALAGGLGLIHVIVEDARWSLYPAYGLSLALVILAGRNLRQPPTKRWRWWARALCVVVGAVFLVGGIGLSLLFPIVMLPAPHGRFAVGTRTIRMVDSARAETLTDAPTDRRAFEIRAWYPTLSRAGRPGRYRTQTRSVGSILETTAGSEGPPEIVFGHLRSIRSHAVEDAPVAVGGPWPVVIYSTGFTSPLDNGQVLAEELASRGWIVLSMSHPFESESQVDSTGRVVPYSRAHAESYRQQIEVTSPRWAKFWSADDYTIRRDLALEMLDQDHFMDEAVRIRTADIRFALDELGRRARRNDPFANRLDLTRIAAIGHSLGGATAYQLALVDDRVKAVVDLDGFVFGDAVRDTLRKPLLLMYSQSFTASNEFLGRRMGPTPVVVTVRGTTHMDFTDDPLVFPITKRLGMAGSIDPIRMREILDIYLVTFLEARVLDGPPAPLDRPSSAFPEVIFPPPVSVPSLSPKTSRTTAFANPDRGDVHDRRRSQVRAGTPSS